VLGTRSVDADGGWFIFTLPPAEIAVHPPNAGGRAVCTCCATTWPPPWPSGRGIEHGLYQPQRRVA